MSSERLVISLKVGDAGTVLGVSNSAGCAKRLADMGFVRGAKVEMVRPGSTCIVRVGGVCVGLGAAHQECIAVCPH